MRTIRTIAVTSLSALLLFSSSAVAQERHAVPPSAMAQAVTDRVAQQDADRAAIREALARPEVQRVADAAHVDLQAMTTAVDAMSTSELAQAASQARQVNDALVGGASTVTISTTTIIIVLLIVILILVAD